ncbi:GntP family permease [Gloeocapsa sp. PCC 73106]|uniref:GntP family permease n=1 Tax=Gloeocapsa sp. PCC 73106 TaxID=102232 RepID=UPI0002ABEEF9|nr:GntP family permease [Gloeocapsa sp. PCC 73106]ELR98068.1 H+/gluconate symporter family protein [Gloeocapsa sp. PCC 73106]
MIGILGILIALSLLIFFAYRGFSVLILGPAMAIVAILLSGGLPTLGSFTQIFMPTLGDFIILYFPIFLLGAIFGKVMDDSGSAQSIADSTVAKLGSEQSILAVVICCAILTFGGVSLFVVAFAVFPVASSLFQKASIPKRLIPATIGLGAFTFTMTALPGSPSIQNAIPMPFFGTTPFSAPGLGIISGIVMFLLGMFWLNRCAHKAKTIGEGYGDHSDALPVPNKAMREQSEGQGFDIMELAYSEPKPLKLPPFTLAVAPIALVIGVNLLAINVLIPAMNTDFLSDPLFGSTTLAAVRGIWAVIIALTVAIVFTIVANWKRFTNLKQTIDDGANASVLPIFNTASLVGFGGIIAALPAFAKVSEWLLGIGGNNPLISLAVSVSVLSGLTGSASGGLSIALDTLAETFTQIAKQQGISLDLMHRVAVVSAGILDSLPHNGAVITLLAICGLTHRQAYKDFFIVVILFPLVALLLLLLLGTLFGSF